jgi:hypothetical protein
MRRFGPPYPTDDWDAKLTIGELCSNDDPRGMLAWAALNYDPHKRDEQDVDDRLAGLFVEIYARLTALDGGLTVDREEIQRLLADIESVNEIVFAAAGAQATRRSA